MRNKRYPNDTDYTTNAPSYYDDLARKQKLIELLAKRIWEYEETLNESLEQIEQRLTDYILENDLLMNERLENWDKRIDEMPEEMRSLFVTWLNDGTLEQIINHDVLGNKADQSELDKTNTLLAQAPTYITPTGTANDSTNINNLIVNGGEFIVKNGVYNIVGEITVKSHTKITFDKNAIFQKTPTNADKYKMLNLFEVENVEINFPHIIGDRDTHTGTTGEWGHGINIQGGKDIYINKPKISDCWGDGIYLGKDYYKGDIHNENVVIYEPLIDNVRRNGISACNSKGVGVTIVRPIIKNVNGTNPQAGIDIEPEGFNARLDRLSIIDPVTEKCQGRGIEFLLGGITDKGFTTYIDIQNHKDLGSTNAIGTWASSGVLNGEITIVNPKYENNFNNAVDIQEYGINTPKINIIRPYILNCNISNKPDYRGSAISIYRESASSNTYKIGNVSIDSPTIIDNKEAKTLKHYFYVRDMKVPGYENVERVDITNPVLLSGHQTSAMVYRALGTVVDNSNQIVLNSGFYQHNVGNFPFYKSYSNKGATDWVTYLLSNIPEGHPSVTFKIFAQKIIIKPPTGGIIRPSPSGTLNQQLESINKGSSVTLKPMGNNEWHIERMVGTWDFV